MTKLKIFKTNKTVFDIYTYIENGKISKSIEFDFENKAYDINDVLIYENKRSKTTTYLDEYHYLRYWNDKFI